LGVDASSVANDAARVTLADLLVSVLLLGIIGSGLFSVLDSGHRAWAFGAARVESQQSARAALARLAAEIRTAGRGGTGFDAVAVIEPDRIVLQQDLNGDGLITANGERVTWRLAGTILRRDAGGGAQPVINGVSGLALSYFDAADAPTTIPSAVRSVEIGLTTRADHAAPARTVSVTFATRVRLRNR
jgi:type II secretory pathway component PulJ